MKIRVPDYYKSFKCIAGACTDTCCAGWQVDVDDKSYAYYKTITGEFGDRLHSVMVDGKKGAEGSFRIRPDGRCPFLNDDNLCDLYAELGEDALCVTCDQYPRYTCEFGNLRETGIAISCKTAAELILKDDRTPGFEEWVDDEVFPSLNNIDGLLFVNLMKARDHAFKILGNRKRSIWERMAVLIFYAADLQKVIKKPEKISGVTEKYTEEYINNALKALSEERVDDAYVTDLYARYFYGYLKQVIIKPEWPKLVLEVEEALYKGAYGKIAPEFSKYYAHKEYEFENLITYFIFRYFMKAVFDKDVLTKVKMAVISVLMIYQCDMGYWVTHEKQLDFTDQIEIVHLYSREVEHSEENFAALSKNFLNKKIYSVKNLVLLLEHIIKFI